jgi:uncharacterized protein involved in exopolysaccharide biosynthesis
MKIRRTLIGLAAVAAALGTFTTAATAQAAYKAEYRMSLVLGPPTLGDRPARSGPTW